MATTLTDWDREVRDAADRLVRAKRDLEEARDALFQERMHRNRLRSSLERSNKNISQVRSSEADVRRRAEEAVRQVEETRKWSQRNLDQPGQGQPEQSRFRIEAEASRLESRLRGMEAEMERRSAEVRRGELAIRSSTERITALDDEIAALERRVKEREQDLRRAARRRDLARRGGHSGGQWNGEANVEADTSSMEEDWGYEPLTITDRASVYLRSVLYAMSPAPGELLRFVPDEDGGIALALDIPRHGDEVVSVGADSVLLVEDPLPPDLQGTTIDVRGSADGPVLVVEPRSSFGT